MDVHTPVSPSDTAPQRYVIRGDGDRPLIFHGWLIGTGQRARRCRGARVSIFGTEKGSVIVQVHRWNVCARPRRDSYSSAVFDTRHGPEDALNWMRDSSGRVGRPGRDAWAQACRNWRTALRVGEEVVR